MSRPAKKSLLLSVMALAVIAGGYTAGQFINSTNASAQMPGGEMPPMPVPIVTIEQKPVQLWKEFSGRLTAVDYVEIRPQVSGIIEKIHFSDGQVVNKGDVLFSIDPRPYEAAAAQARAEVASASEDSKYAAKELGRAEELLKTGAISKQGYDERVNSQKVNKNGISAANARLKAAQVDLDHATIKAPISGRISRPEITEGNLVTAATAPLLTTVVSEESIYGDFEVDEQTYLSFVRTGAGRTVEGEKEIPVRLILKSDTADAKPYSGVIKSFDNKINPSSGTIRARAVFANEDGALLPGMFAKVQIGSAGEQNTITVPIKAVLTDQSRKFVYVSDNNAATYREVKLGDTIGNTDQIVLSGLKPGDKVIIDGLMKIRPGAKIDPKTPQEMEKMKAAMAAQAQQGAAPAAAPKEEPKKEEAKKDDKAKTAQE
jgi:membrane fusion protein, multidrug efflux system